MKRIVFFISLLISIGAGAQLTPTYIGGPNSLVTSRGPFRSDSSLGNPLRDTTFKPYSVGIQVFRTADSSIYVSVSTTASRKWKKVGDAVPSTTWGSITGTLASQADLVAALAAKQNTITTGTTSQYLRGDLTLGTFSSAVTAIGDPIYSPIGHSHSGLIPTGGTTGQVLTKVNSTDYNYTWSNPAAGSGTVTNIATGLWLGGGPITTTGTIQIDSANLFNQTTGALRRKDSLTSTNLKGYVTRTVLKDSMAIWRANSGILQQPTITYDVSSTYLSFPRTGLSTLTMDLIGGQPTSSSNVPYYNGSNLAWNSGLAIRASNVITSGSDTLANKAYVRSIAASLGLSLNLDQVMANSGTLTVNRSVNHSTFSYNLGGTTGAHSASYTSGGLHGDYAIDRQTWQTNISSSTKGNYTYAIADSFVIASYNIPTTLRSSVKSTPDSLTFFQTNGFIKIPVLTAGASTDSALVYNTTTKKVGYKAFPTGGGSSYTDADAITAPLTGFTTVSPSTVLSSDDILSAIEKLQAQIDDPFYTDTDKTDGDGTSGDPLTVKAPTIVTSTSTSLSLTNTGQHIKTYVFTGGTAATWTLPAVGSTGQILKIKNRGTVNVVVQRAGSNNIYTTSAVTSITVTPGDFIELQDDGTYWNYN